jgi:hypothetical protein
MSPMCFPRQHAPAASSPRPEVQNEPAGERARSPTLMHPAVSRAKKKERRRKSGRPSWISLSEEGSSVSCIAAQAEYRSNFFEGNSEETAKLWERHTHISSPRDEWNFDSHSRLPRPCFFSPSWNWAEMHPGAR